MKKKDATRPNQVGEAPQLKKKKHQFEIKIKCEYFTGREYRYAYIISTPYTIV